jgi:hypothetical protein
LNPAFLRIYPTVVSAGTELERLYRAGCYAPLTLAEAVAVCKVMLMEALRASVPVVRIGLQATVELQEGRSVVAGPWHPAFRQLVTGELFYDLAVQLAAGLGAGRDAVLAVAPVRLSDAAGHRRTNLHRLREHHGVRVTAVRGDAALASTQLRLEHAGAARTGDLLKDLDYAKGSVCHA